MIGLKIMVFLLVLASLNTMREIFLFVVNLATEGKHQEYSKGRLILFGCSVAYIMTIITTGFSLV